ncbi:AraC family transcriptional regulator [Shewanella maritima]|uniref:AraC family transcriptional regulator n=1 Tax=Shewanella maritima TaxID=2520507 RepID=UPI00373698C6
MHRIYHSLQAIRMNIPMAPFKRFAIMTAMLSMIFGSPAYANDEKAQTLANELEDIKAQVLKLNRDLFILEEDLLFPASTQVGVFVSVDIGKFFKLDSVELKLNDENVAGFLYTERQRIALERGGIQRVYLGNLKTGQHQLTAIFTGRDYEGRDVQRAVTHMFDKDDEAVMLELQLTDTESSMRADIVVEQWEL